MVKSAIQSMKQGNKQNSGGEGCWDWGERFGLNLKNGGRKNMGSP